MPTDSELTLRLRRFDGILEIYHQDLTHSEAQARRAPDSTEIFTLQKEHAYLDGKQSEMRPDERIRFVQDLQPLFHKVIALAAQVKREAVAGSPREAESTEARLKRILQSEIDRTAQNISIIKTNTEQFSLLSEQHKRIELTLQSAVGHIRALQRIQWTEDKVEAVARVIFLSVCTHICLSRLGVYWLLSVLGVRGAFVRCLRIIDKYSRVGVQLGGEYSRTTVEYAHAHAIATKPFFDAVSTYTYPASMWLIQFWLSVMLISA